jgi:hypothetical protein
MATETLTHPDSNQDIEVDAAHVERYLGQGWREKATDAPKGNASLEEWQGYARTKDFTEEDIEGKSRDELRAALA